MIDQNSKYFILVRHASREHRWDLPESQHSMKGYSCSPPASGADFDRAGFIKTYAMAGRLCDQLLLDEIIPLPSDEVASDEKRRQLHILHSTHLVAEQTAEIFEKVISHRTNNNTKITRYPSSFLTPISEHPDEPANDTITWAQVKEGTWDEGTNSVLLMVGHQPNLTTIADELLGRTRFGRPLLPTGTLPIGSSEIACLELEEIKRLSWLLTAKPDSLLDELREKISSKYNVAKFILGAFVVNTGIILNADIWDTSNVERIALGTVSVFFAFLSLGATVATLLSYDSLMMPFTFWSESRKGKTPEWSVRRPPSQGHMILYYEMVHTWNDFFIPAIVTAFLSIYLFVISLAYDSLSNLLGREFTFLSAIIVGGFLWGSIWIWYWLKRPRLGSED